MLKKTSITRRTFLFATLLIVVVTFVSFAILYLAMPSYYLYKKKQSLKFGTEELERQIKNSTDKNEIAAKIADFTTEYNVTITSFDLDGIPILELSTPFLSMNQENSEETRIIINGEEAEEEQLQAMIAQIFQLMQTGEENPVIEHQEQEFDAYITYYTNDEMLFLVQIGSDIIGKMEVRGTLQPIEEARGVILSLIPYVLAVGGMIGLCLAWMYAKQITKPILMLSDTAVRMEKREQNVSSGIRTNDEWGILSRNMDALYENLSETIEGLKTEMEKVNRLEQSKTEMMQSASHELKTPIAALSGMLDGMIDNIGVYKDKEIYLLKCKEQVEKLSFLVMEILEASKVDCNDKADKLAYTEIDVMIKHILTEHEVSIREKELNVHLDLEHMTIETEPVIFYRAMTNLIGNAVRYTPEHGDIHIVLSTEHLVIENQCSQIPEGEVEKLFEPFYTRSSSRDKTVSGTGLGLYIVKRNLERLSISYEVQNTETGFGIRLFLDNQV